MSIIGAIFLLALTAAPSGEPGGILDPLIEKCAEIDDEYMVGKTGTEARLSIMRSLNGKIGPITYVHAKSRANAKQTTVDTGFGTTYTGPLKGPHVFPTAGKYIAQVPPGFDKRVKQWAAEALKGTSTVARAELASALFTESYVGKGQLNEEKMFLLYRAAAEDGNAGAMFMCGVCRYYGIGISKDEKKALKMLKLWKELSGETKAKRGGWVARRFATINQ